MKNKFFTIPGVFLIKKYKIPLIWLILFTFLTIGFEMISLGTIIPLFNVILVGEYNDTSHGMIVDSLTTILNNFPKKNLFITICIFYFFITLVKVIFKSSRDILRTILSQIVLKNCQKEMFEKNIYSNMKFFIDNKLGDLVFRVINLPREIAAYFTLLPSIFVEAVNIIVLCVFLLTISLKLFFAIIAIGFFYSLMIRYISKNVFEKIGKEIPEVLSWQNIIVNESIGGIRDIVTYGKHKGWVQRFFDKTEQYYQLRTKVCILRLLPGNTLELLIVAGMCAFGILYSRNYMNELVKILPVLAVFATALIKMIPAFARIGQERIQLSSYIASVKLYESLQKEQTKFFKDKGNLFQSFNQEIRLDNVHFSYYEGQKVLNGVNLIIPKNKTVAIVAGSGGGKSTLIDLLLGLYEVTKGQIVIDGINLKEYSSQSWRSKIGVVSQNSFIFNASAKHNIAFSFTDIDMNQVISAAKQAGAFDFIDDLKDKFDTELGDRVYALSWGQRQRIAIARALYRNPDIIVFDEATSALDYRSEKTIRETIYNISKNKTIIILAHRLSTIENADIIYVLKDGKVTQGGTHAELLKQKGEYAQLYLKD